MYKVEPLDCLHPLYNLDTDIYTCAEGLVPDIFTYQPITVAMGVVADLILMLALVVTGKLLFVPSNV